VSCLPWLSSLELRCAKIIRDYEAYLWTWLGLPHETILREAELAAVAG
jgi:hypothetical protein